MIIRICVQEDEAPKILKSCHDEHYGGNLVDIQTTNEVLVFGYY